MKFDSKSSQIATIGTAAGSILVAGALILRRWLRSRKTPPTLSCGLPLVGPIVQFLKSPLELIEIGYKKHGECFKEDHVHGEEVDLRGELFFTQDKYLDQAKLYSFSVPVFGPKVLYDTDYSTRMCQLRFIRERLTDDCLSGYTATLEAEVRQFFAEEWPGDGGVVDIRKSMVEALTRTSVRCLMGEELRSKMHAKAPGGKSVCELLNMLEHGMLPLSVFLPHLPIPRHRQRDWARREMTAFFEPILKDRRRRLAAGESPEEDFLWKVMTAKYPDGREVTDEEVVGFLIAAFFGGMHNSSITTTWSTLEIFTRPSLVKELIDEQTATLGGVHAPFTYDSYERMKKMRSTVMETLRMHPPLMMLFRTVEEDLTFKNYTIPRGSAVAVSPSVAGTLEESYAQPSAFKPFRFVDGVKDEFAYIPFGAGRRLCKGQEFGFLQIQCVLSHMLRHYDVVALDGVTQPTCDGMVVAPMQPCRVQYRRKRTATATA
mmetsp:Transcript_47337/g.122306  ORF Transcript_47337/g.122306 Transcript_47337/m.122306 type:complete len:488 (+) Transcript_47337:107-1570(+)